MLNSILDIGRQKKKDIDDWSAIISRPKVKQNKKNYLLNILFHLDEQDIVISKDNLSEYDPEKTGIKFSNVNTELWGRRGDPWAVCVEFPKKIRILQKSILGYPADYSSNSGLFLKAIDSYFSEDQSHKEKKFYKALGRCYSLKNIEKTERDEEDKEIVIHCEDKLTKDYIGGRLKLNKDEEVVLISIFILDSFLDITQPTPLSALEGYKEIIEKRFLSNTKDKQKSGLCYVTGTPSSSLVSPDFADREDLNKIFVTTTKNYASGFDDKNYYQNYSMDADTRKYLKIGSDFIRGKLDAPKLSVRIAGILHYIIPQFLNNDSLDTDYYPKLQQNSESLFSKQEYLELTEALADTIEIPMYWINYIAYQSDGNSVKIINHIKDVNKFHLNTVIDVFSKTGKDFKDWLGSERAFNLQTTYYQIPVREKTTTNQALSIFSSILEQRKIRKEILMEHFTELVLCHRYGRYKAYQNINAYTENFDVQIRDAVFHYTALIQALRSLNLLQLMEEIQVTENLEPIEETLSDYQQKIEKFFTDMNYNQAQKALFYLGRALNTIAYTQSSKGHDKKPVMNKLNYNGMDKDDIVRLRCDLAEKAKQYSVVPKTDYSFSHFSEYFDYNQWNTKPKEALFFILTGYSFGFTRKKED